MRPCNALTTVFKLYAEYACALKIKAMKKEWNEIRERILKDQSEEDLRKMLGAVMDVMDAHWTEDKQFDFMKRVHYRMYGGHYDEFLAMQQVRHMYWEDDNSNIHYVTPLPLEQVRTIYQRVYSRLKYKTYNMYDFYVELHRIKSDRYPKATDITDEMIQDTIVSLNDPDNPFGLERVWGYFNSEIKK